MARRIHSVLALLAALIVSFMAVTGVILSIDPATQELTSPATPAEENVAQLAAVVAANTPTVERIVRSASGSLTAYFATDTGTAAATVDPTTGVILSAYEPSAFFSFFTELHRSLFLDSTGRAVAGLAALALLVLAVSGTTMLVRRIGGWRKLFGRMRGGGAQRLHTNLARLAAVGLVVSALTGIYMSLVSFGFIADGGEDLFAFPDGVNGGPPAGIDTLTALVEVPLGQLRELVFPYAGDPTDVFTITTSRGEGFVDQATGAMLSFTPNSVGQSIYEFIYMVHTGQGAWWVGMLLGIAALGVPVMAVSGIAIWWRRRRSLPRLRGNTAPNSADTIILVGSEGNTTWGFATALHDALTRAGRRVHTAAMNGVASEYRRAERLFILTATYGDGAAPASARHFLSRLAGMSSCPDVPFTVLGFGDRAFPRFCQFANDVEAALIAKGGKPFQPMATIDRQSSQAFQQWGTATGIRLGTRLQLEHTPPRPRTLAWVLVDREDFGLDVQAPTAILRFALDRARAGGIRSFVGWGPRLPRFAAGDVVGVLAPGSAIPRYYSLASSSRDGTLEICVRKLPGGLCSEFLHGLAPGDTIEAFIRTNPDFRPAPGRVPVIMVGAGTGIAPLAGFVRGNTRHRPVHLYWGGRDPRSDFLYGSALIGWVQDSRLTSLVTAFSRMVNGGYVQDRLRADQDKLRALIARGAQIMVCGGKDMAQGVRDAVGEIVAPLGSSVGALKAAGRYLEDVY